MSPLPLFASLRAAVRSLRRRGRTTLLSVGGLALGVGVCLLAGLYVSTQLSYDHHHEDADRIYRLHDEGRAHTYDDPYRYLAEEYAGDVAVTAFEKATAVVRRPERASAAADGGRAARTSSLYYVPPSVFDVFTYPLARGDTATALQDPSSIVISQEAAQTHFPDQNPIGETLLVPSGEGTLELTVTGVMKRLPQTLHVRPDYLVPIDNLRDENGELRAWLYVYVRTFGSTTIDDVTAWLNEQRDERQQRSFAIQSQPLTDIYLHADLSEEIAPTGNFTYVVAFGIVGLLVLVIACINYVNLTTAQVAERMRSVGLRKTFGASRGQVAAHFLAEAGLVTGVSVGLGLLLASAAVPVFNEWAPDPVSISRLWSLEGAALIVGVTALTALLASAYPAAYLSGLRPIQLFRGGGQTGGGQATLRRALVVTQFAIAMALVAVTVVIVQQTEYLAEKDLGLDREHTLMVNTRLAGTAGAGILSTDERARRLDVIEQRLKQRADVRATGRMAYRPNSDYVFFFDLRVPDAEESVEARVMYGTKGVSRAMGIPLVAGQRLDEAPEGILINQAAAERLGDAAQVGAPLQLSTMRRDTTTVIAGIMENFHYQSLRTEITPAFLMPAGFWREDEYLFVRSRPGQTDAVLEATRDVWTDVMPAGTFDYTFMDGEFAEMHRADRQQRNLLLALAGITLFVACLGLVGLVAYLADRRRAEIGVRKTLGASTTAIVRLFTKDVLIGLGVAFALAVPAAYLAASAWLESFAYRIDLGPTAFAAAGLVVGAFALGAAASQAWRAAQVDPAVAVRDE
jgi:putative ABC transport system permease protein